MLSLIRWSEDCFTGWQSGVCIVGNRGKEGGRNLGWISQHVVMSSTRCTINNKDTDFYFVAKCILR